MTISDTVLLQVGDDALGYARVRESRGTDGNQRRPGPEILSCVGGGRNPSHTDDGHPAGALEHAVHRTHTDGEEGRAADPARPVTQPLAAITVGEAARHRIHDGNAIGAGVARHDGNSPDIRENRRELCDEGETGALATLLDDLCNARGVGTELNAAGAGVGARKVQFIRGDAVDALESLDDGGVLYTSKPTTLTMTRAGGAFCASHGR